MTAVLPQQGSGQDDLGNILYRRQQLQNRLQFLQEIQKRNNRIEGNLANEEGPSELDRIEEELKLLEQKEKDLIKKTSSSLTTQSQDPFQAPVQGLYILPVSLSEIVSPVITLQEQIPETVSPIKAVQEEKKETNVVPEKPKETVSPIKNAQKDEDKEPLVKLEDVGMTPARVKCPACHKIVTTEINYKVGSNAFLFCCLLSVVGCLVGCCLVPFCMDRFKDVAHMCPSCQKKICSVDRL